MSKSRTAAAAAILASETAPTSTDETVVTETVVTPTPAPQQTGARSIRQIIRTGLLAGRSTKDIADEVREFHPNSAAAAKSTKHIAYYRSLMRKGGELPKFER